MKKRSLLISFVVVVLGMNPARAAVKIPYEFEAGQPARAAEVNANFKALQDAIEQLQTVVTKLEAQNGSLAKENQALKTTLADLQAQIGKLAKQVAAAPKQSAAAAAPTPIPTAKGLRLRSKPITVSDAEAKQQFKLNNDLEPLHYIENHFEDQGEVVLDQATGLMWEKSGSATPINYQHAREYIIELNRERFAGYRDWRLPTVDELLSLVARNVQSNGLYLNPIFSNLQTYCWSADLRRSMVESAWLVHFGGGHVFLNELTGSNYIRAVRP